ncbi:MAG: hypothetical protein DRO67_06655 [Candidatus Asgardarchaeum californiense]|nr:MAG: hypothetical protein DRO67_06655 [Candidatus Asgardarchaeum californiense]
MIHVEKIDNTIEELIITGIIVDTGFLQNIDRAIRPEYFVTDVNRILVSWIKEYFKENKVSPGEEITDIFRLNQGELDEDESKTVRIFLNKISKEYEGREFNSEYVLPKAFKYLELNAYDYKVKLLKRELRRGNLEKVKHIFNGATKDIFEQVTAWKSLSDISLLQSWWGEKQEPAMSFPGELGIYMPNIERGRLYAMLGPPKRGKSYWLMEWAYNGAWDGLNVVFFSLEMASHEVDARWKERISAKAIMPRRNREFTIPVKDCVHNQKNTCQIEQCTSPGTCVYEDKLRESYDDHPEHVACTYCEGIDDELFKPTYWMEKTTLARLSLKEASTTQEQFDDHVGKDRIRIITYPIASATVQDLENSLNELERHENFIPDLIVIDYADILKEDLKLGDKRHRVGDNWQKLSRMAKVRNAIVVTASQGNRSSAKKNRLDVDDVSEDFSKVMTIDGIFAINEVNFDQPDKWQVDKNWQIQRIETIALRYGKFTPGLQCVVMNDLARAQIHIDSYISWK